MHKKSIKVFFLVAVMISTLSSCGELQQIASTSSQDKNSTNSQSSSAKNTEISQAEANSGVKQALNSALQNSIKSLSVKDGFLRDEAVKILLPPQAQKVEKTLRSVGMGNAVDKFITNMNRAAESAVKEAGPVFVNALSQLTVQDAFNILLSGQNDAATNFFKRTTSDELNDKFKPIIQSALGKYQVDTYWTQLTTAYNGLPIAQDKIETDLNTYVTLQAINGLFTKVAGEELKIRDNLGGARNTDTLKKVFDWVDKQKK